MSIYQLNLFVCEFCGKTTVHSHTVFLYDDPVIICPNNEKWDYTKDDKLACPECLKLEKI